jgi:Fic family protein
MISFDANFDQRLPPTYSLMRTIGLLREFRGREESFRRQIPQSLETLKAAAVIQSTESSSRIEGVTAPLSRIRELVEMKTTPQDRSEQEIAGYRDVLDIIHRNHQSITLSAGVVQQLHRELFKYTDETGGRWKAVPNDIVQFGADGSQSVRFSPPRPHLTDGLMQSLHESLDRFRTEQKVDSLLIIATYVLDFLCIHPFHDGNGRMARLLTLLLLYQEGYQVGRFISLETIIENSKESYYDTLFRSSQGWTTGEHSLTPWTEYLLGTFVAAYREFEGRVDLLKNSHGSKTDMVLEAIANSIGEFTIQDLVGKCPNVGIDLIRLKLKEQKELGKVECLGRGRNARWRRIG